MFVGKSPAKVTIRRLPIAMKTQANTPQTATQRFIPERMAFASTPVDSANSPGTRSRFTLHVPEESGLVTSELIDLPGVAHRGKDHIEGDIIGLARDRHRDDSSNVVGCAGLMPSLHDIRSL